MIWEAYNKAQETIELGIEGLVLRKRKLRGEGISYVIYDNSHSPIKMLGHLSGFEDKFGKHNGMFHLYKTELTEETRNDPQYQNRGIYRTAVQRVANLYPNGLYVSQFEASPQLRNSLKRMNTYEFLNDDRYIDVLHIKPE
jgi:hypothetical protein